jgi:predicted dehydrogenase
MKDLRVGVIGCGFLGSRHAEIYHQLPHVKLVGICDTDFEKARKVASLYDSKAYDNLELMLGTLDAASICTPAHAHHEVSKPLLEQGVHLLIEKPITTQLAEADELLQIAREKNLTLQTGHIERFNAAVRVIKDIVKKPRFIECDRIGPYSNRIIDVGVVLDLMIHDIDIVLHIVGSKVKSVDTIGLNLMSETEDFANCRLHFENGTVCDLTASRIARDRLRKIRIFQEDAYISLDYIRQEALILTKKNGSANYQTVDIKKSEPLREELTDFISCIQKKERPLVSGEEGRAALSVALQILECIRSN